MSDQELLASRLFEQINHHLQNGLTVSAEPIQALYSKVEHQLKHNNVIPVKAISFGTSGWRGILGSDINVFTVAVVTSAIIKMYRELDENDLAKHLGVKSFEEVQERGCVLGFDNRFGGKPLSLAVVHALVDAGIKVYYAGESTTGVLSAAVLEVEAAFSINLTPSHNPLEYGGYKFNAADAGPASKEITTVITENSRALVSEKEHSCLCENDNILNNSLVTRINSLELWREFVAKNYQKHKVDIDVLARKLQECQNLCFVIDSVHGASRLHTKSLFRGVFENKISFLRNTADVTFGGVAPEPSHTNLQAVVDVLRQSNKPLKLGAIIDPDGDRIRFTDGTAEITMNQFGAIAYHFLHEYRGLNGLVAKSVASSNLANALATHFQEDIFEPAVGFKEFKPVLGKALVCFEESDGISIIGHTPEKDAYIGLLLALDIVLTTGKNLGEYLKDIESLCGAFYPKVDSATTNLYGKELIEKLSGLNVYKVGDVMTTPTLSKTIEHVIGIDGHKFVFDDGSWLLIRPSGTEPKIRLYVEARELSGRDELLDLGRSLLTSLGLVVG